MAAQESSTGVPVSVSGQWNWYRSTWSVPRRLRLCSSSNRTVSGRRSWVGSLPSRPYQGRPHLVNTSTSPPCSRSTCPTTSSECPRPYTAAVSTQFTPDSKALWSAAIDSSSSWGPQPSRPGPPIAQAPTATTETSGPSLPSLRNCMPPPRPSLRSSLPRPPGDQTRLDRGLGAAVGGQVDRPQAGRGPVDAAHLGAGAALAQDHVGGVVGAPLEQRGADGVGVDRDLGGLEGGDPLGREAARDDHPHVREAPVVQGPTDLLDQAPVDPGGHEVPHLRPQRAVDHGPGGVQPHPPQPLPERPGAGQRG